MYAANESSNSLSFVVFSLKEVGSLNQSIHIGPMSGYIDQDIWKSLPDGDIHLIFRSTDILGNQESVFIIVVKLTQLTRDDFPIWIAIIISASGVSIIAAAYIYYRRFYLKRRDE